MRRMIHEGETEGEVATLVTRSLSHDGAWTFFGVLLHALQAFRVLLS
jgi:hypothetical protein